MKKERRFVEEGKASKLPQVCVTVQFGGESELGALQIERFESGVGVLLGLSKRGGYEKPRNQHTGRANNVAAPEAIRRWLECVIAQ